MGMLKNKTLKLEIKDGRKIVKLTGFGKSKTQQHMRQACDINSIMKKYYKNGQFPLATSMPNYGDYSTALDFQEAMNIIVKGEEQFMSLPVELRNKFKNNPEEFLRYVETADHKDLVELGLAVHVSNDHNMDGVRDQSDIDMENNSANDNAAEKSNESV